MTERCDLTDLPVDGCAHCRQITEQPSYEDITVRMAAVYDGRCASCGHPVSAGDEIGHSDEAGGWVRIACCGGGS